MTDIKKRFISGARCPNCNAEDELVMYEVDARDVMECLACGHKQKRPSLEEQNREKARAEEVTVRGDVQVVQLKPKVK